MSLLEKALQEGNYEPAAPAIVMRSLKKFMTKKKPVGAPRGNQNARKHGLYSRVLDEGQKLQLDKARAVKGLDEEIAIMRVKLLTLIDKYPERIDLQIRAVSAITRMVLTRFNISAALDNCLLPRAGQWRPHARKARQARRHGRG